jgi:Icc protein
VDLADFCFVHFTDTHIAAAGLGTPIQLDTSACLRQVVDVLRVLKPQPAFGIVGGDLVSPSSPDQGRELTAEEHEPSYLLLQEILNPLPFPIHMLMGNHDSRPAFHRAMHTGAATSDAPYRYGFEHEGIYFVILDSQKPGEIWGRIEAPQLAWLQQDLKAHRGQPTMVFVHHHPWPLGIPWLDDWGLRNGEELVSVLRQHPEAGWIICGHVHMDQLVQRQGLTMLSTPSTCAQLTKLSVEFKDPLPGPPAFRLFWIKGGELSTRVVHLHPGEMASLSRPVTPVQWTT